MRIVNWKLKIKNCERGLSIFLAVTIMATLLSLALGVSSVLLGGQKTLQEIGSSIVAFYAAETGIESGQSGYLDLNGNGVQDSLDSSYQVSVAGSGLKSIGSYKTSRRAIQITR